MIKMLRGRAIAGASEKRERVSYDYYATDPRAVISLLKVEKMEFPLLEPACGEGHICETVKYYYPDSKIVCSDLIYRGYGVGGVDFLKSYNDTHFKTILTNPPFRNALEFIKHGLEVADKVIIFAKIQLLEGIQRYEELYSTGKLKKVYVFVNRQNVWRNGSPVDENGKRYGHIQGRMQGSITG